MSISRDLKPETRSDPGGATEQKRVVWVSPAPVRQSPVLLSLRSSNRSCFIYQSCRLTFSYVYIASARGVSGDGSGCDVICPCICCFRMQINAEHQSPN